MATKNKLSSPVNKNPLRRPGQSLNAILLDYVINYSFKWGMAFVFVFACIMWEGFRQLVPFKISVWFLLIPLLGLSAVFYIKSKGITQQIRKYRIGIFGEQIVGECLADLRKNGYHVFHDIEGTGFNIDHVVVGPGGVFSIETKTWRKGKNFKDIFNKEGRIYIETIDKGDAPIIQAKAASNWLQQKLTSKTGRNINVQPVVVFPGWFVKNNFGKVWVFNENHFVKHLNKYIKPVLSSEDIALYSERIDSMNRESNPVWEEIEKI